MAEVKVVIGANFGDEGKGLMTDYFCHKAISRGKSCIVVLHNGGSQRGHTVETPEGIKHVFHHFGSGTLAGADTYFADKFILNPMIFRQEWEELAKKGFTPKVFSSKKCMVTTPFDMIINQIVEEWRSENRHGSCGMGINETIQRYKHILTWGLMDSGCDFYNREFLKCIRDHYLPYRLEQLGIKNIAGKWKKIIHNEGLIDHYIEDAKFMVDHITFEQELMLREYESVVFENGQGLLLDQNNLEYAPHLTSSNTGCKNPADIIRRLFSLSDIEVCYVTRTYLTRHGAGPMENECDKNEINSEMEDLTNIPNPHQGSLRYGKLDMESLVNRVCKDFDYIKKHSPRLSIVFTHTNEYPLDMMAYRQYVCRIADRTYATEGRTGRLKSHEKYIVCNQKIGL